MAKAWLSASDTKSDWTSSGRSKLFGLRNRIALVARSACWTWSSLASSKTRPGVTKTLPAGSRTTNRMAWVVAPKAITKLSTAQRIEAKVVMAHQRTRRSFWAKKTAMRAGDGLGDSNSSEWAVIMWISPRFGEWPSRQWDHPLEEVEGVRWERLVRAS